MNASWYPLIGVALFVGVGFGWRVWLHNKRYGASGVMLFRSGRAAQHAREAGMVLLLVLLLGEAVIMAGTPERLQNLMLPLPTIGWLRSAGLAAVVVGTGLMALAQLHMGSSWRIGIDTQAKPGLVTSGLYRLSRNPIYMALFVCLAGLVLMMPTWLSVGMLVGTVIGVRSAVHEEEGFLAQTYGEEYRRYAARVGRFVPGVGKN